MGDYGRSSGWIITQLCYVCGLNYRKIHQIGWKIMDESKDERGVDLLVIGTKMRWLKIEVLVCFNRLPVCKYRGVNIKNNALWRYGIQRIRICINLFLVEEGIGFLKDCQNRCSVSVYFPMAMSKLYYFYGRGLRIPLVLLLSWLTKTSLSVIICQTPPPYR